MALLDCEVTPREGATPEQLRTLGSAIGVWAGRESSDSGMLHFISRNALADLSNGNPPPPFVEQFQEMLNDGRALSGITGGLDPESQRQERHRLKEAMGEACFRRTIFFQVRGSYATRSQVLANLRENFPAHLIQDVIVGDRSWEGC
jgi:hypothetical protein